MRSIYRALAEAEESASAAGAVATWRSQSQSADLFQELQREVAACVWEALHHSPASTVQQLFQVMVKLQVPMATGRSLPSSPLPLTLAPPEPHRQIYLPPPSPSSSSASPITSRMEEKPVLPPRSPVPPLRPSKSSLSGRSGGFQARSGSGVLAEQGDAPPQIPPRDHTFSQPGSRSSSPQSFSSTIALPPPPAAVSPRRAYGLLAPLVSSASSSPPRPLQVPPHSPSCSLLEPFPYEGRGLVDSPQSSASHPRPDRPAFSERSADFS